MEKPLRSLIDQAIQSRLFPGCVIGIRHENGTRSVYPFGRLTYDPDAPAVDAETLYDIASITKSIPTACCACALWEQNRLGLDEPVKEFIEELSGPRVSTMRVRHLLTHTIDLGFPLSSLKNHSSRALCKVLFTAGLVTDAGTTFAYSNAASILLGFVVERRSGMKLDIAARTMFFHPLGMNHTTFQPSPEQLTGIAPTENDPWRGRRICGEVHDESAWALRPDIIAGSAGLFSTAGDLLVFCDMLLQGGRVHGRHFLAPATIAAMATNQIPSLGDACQTGLGWEVCRPEFMGEHVSPTAFGKTGFTGCSCLCDPGRQKALVILSNHTFPRRHKNRAAIHAFRRSVANGVFG